MTAIDGNITPKIALEITSIKVSPGQYATSAIPNSGRGDHIGFTVFFQDVSQRKNTLFVFNAKYGTGKIKFGQGKRIVGPKYIFRPATTDSIHCWERSDTRNVS